MQELTIILSRVQFALALAYHIIFPTINIGLCILIAIFEYKWIKTGDESYQKLTKFFTKVFALAFGMGVVSVITLAFMFGTNFAKFSLFTGNVIGPLLSYEVLTAFFLEATFLGVMLFGWKRVSQKMHFLATTTVGVGTLISAFWILAANSFMHTPQGFGLNEKGMMIAESWMKIIFNPSFPYRYSHMIVASLISAGLLVSAICAYNLLKKKNIDIAKKGLNIALLSLVITTPLQVFIGDLHGINAFEHQPMKVAAMEGRWDTMKGAPLILFAVPDSKNERNELEVSIPKLASLILTHDTEGTVHGLKEVEQKDRPPVGIVFYGFRVMVGLGFIFILLSFVSYYKLKKDKLSDCPFILKSLILMGPMGVLATIIGWIVAECGRQPWIVQNVMRTSDGASVLNPAKVMFSLTLFSLVYTLIFIVFLYFFFKIVKKGIDSDAPHPVIDTYQRTAWHETE